MYYDLRLIEEQSWTTGLIWKCTSMTVVFCEVLMVYSIILTPIYGWSQIRPNVRIKNNIEWWSFTVHLTSRCIGYRRTMDHCNTNSVNYDIIFSHITLSSRRLMKSHHLIHNKKTWALNQDTFPQLKSCEKGNVVVLWALVENHLCVVFKFVGL